MSWTTSALTTVCGGVIGTVHSVRSHSTIRAFVALAILRVSTGLQLARSTRRVHIVAILAGASTAAANSHAVRMRLRATTTATTAAAVCGIRPDGAVSTFIALAVVCVGAGLQLAR